MNAGQGSEVYRTDAESAGKPASEADKHAADIPIEIIARDGVRYTVPSTIHIDRMEDLQKIRFRVGAVYRDASVVIDFNDKVFRSQKKRILAPGEMEQVILKKSDLEAAPDLKTITIRIEEAPKD